MVRYAFILTMTIALLGSAEVRFEVSSSCTSVPANGLVDVTVVAQWPQSDVTYIIYTPHMPEHEGLRVDDHVSFGESVAGSSQVVQRIVHHYRLCITNPPGATALTGPIVVDYRRGDQQERSRETLAGLNFAVSSPTRRGLHAALIALVAAGAVVALVLAYTARRSGEARVAAANGPTLEDAYLARLEQARRLRLDGDLAEYFNRLEELLRGYFREKYLIATIEEWRAPTNGPAGPDEKSTSIACNLLALAHKVRYASYEPSAHEQSRMFDFISQLLNRNQPRRSRPEEELYLQRGKSE
jgi:hypothetical protein